MSTTAEIIVPSFTFRATAQAVMVLGYTPVFVDVKETYNMDPTKLEHVLTEKTEAILAVHTHGRPCDMEAILRFADEHNLVVIEDAAQAHDATFEDRKVGTFGNAGCFSMQSSKHLGIGEGGFVLTDDPDFAQEMRDIGTFRFDMLMHADSGFGLFYVARDVIFNRVPASELPLYGASTVVFVMGLAASHELVEFVSYGLAGTGPGLFTAGGDMVTKYVDLNLDLAFGLLGTVIAALSHRPHTE